MRHSKLFSSLILLCFASFVSGSIVINPGAKVVQFAGKASFSGNLINNGIFSANGESSFIGSNNSIISGVNEFYSMSINKSSGSVIIANDIRILNNLSFQNGNLITGDYTVSLENSGTLSGESSSSSIIGNLYISRYVNTTANSLGNAGLSISSGLDNLGIVKLYRTTGTNGIVNINSADGIKRKWYISPQNQPLHGRDITFNWLANEDNGIDLTRSKVWLSSNGNNWQTIGQLTNASVTRSITVPTTYFGHLTVNSSSEPLPSSITFEEDGSKVVNFTAYISGAKKKAQKFSKKISQVSEFNKATTLTVTGNNNIIADINGFDVTFSANEDWNGTENLEFSVYDPAKGSTILGTVAVIVSPVNDPPVNTTPPSIYMPIPRIGGVINGSVGVWNDDKDQ
ncbi:MAG: hypothetical protein JXR48_16045 [Candidatus Delongbacteria bacterium]|nr:hypothetical protein [Candidatus Delongbacteria bacterium]MBN2836470.1 hypothetical protein [Candidatus Delongbacteria bacterium]